VAWSDRCDPSVGLERLVVRSCTSGQNRHRRICFDRQFTWWRIIQCTQYRPSSLAARGSVLSRLTWTRYQVSVVCPSGWWAKKDSLSRLWKIARYSWRRDMASSRGLRSCDRWFLSNRPGWCCLLLLVFRLIHWVTPHVFNFYESMVAGGCCRLVGAAIDCSQPLLDRVVDQWVSH
jgi:hypothetical protein